MLQQTQVKTVIPYWNRWMGVLPDLKSVAMAELDQLYKLWEGLGYYTRVRNIRAAANVILTKHGGVFPREFDAILDLPGIGRYTAGAIASIAFGEPRPIVDGNIIRVFARVFGIADEVRTAPVREKLWTLANEFIQSAPKARCADANQAVMELGATVCLPREPRCSECPIQKHCRAYRENQIPKYPNLGRRAATTRRQFAAFIVEHAGQFLVRRRPEGVVNARLWEFPNIEGEGEAGLPAQRLFGRKALTFSLFAEISHSITRYRIQVKVWRTDVRRAFVPTAKGEYRWACLPELQTLSFPSAHRAILEKIAAAN